MSTDINYFSISQNTFTVDAGSEHSHQTDRLPPNNVFIPLKASVYTDILKFSNQQHFAVENCKVSQGKEDSVDINNKCKDILLTGEFGIGGGGSQVITVKGGSSDIYIIGTSHGNKIEIGNWSDQTYDISQHISLNLVSTNGKKIQVSIGRATNVTLLGDCKKNYFGSMKIKMYWWLKWFVRKLSGIKVGQSGPSWL